MIKLLSLFSGIGAFETALRRGGYQFETVNYCEIDPYASKAYSQIHGISEDFNLHDVRTINPLLMNNVNLVTFGFPCQDISIAGKQKGFEHNGERTRSGLFFEALRIIEFLQPEYAICENVKALTSKKFEKEFNTVLSSLAEVGYNNYWKVLNAKDFGIPQNRERIFIISIRKDIDTGTFTFPEKQELKLRVKDVLEPVVDEKYYIDNERSRNLIRQITTKFDLGGGIAVSDGTIKDPKVKDVSNTIKARYDCGIENQKSVGCMVLEPVICRSVGRDPDNPSNREKGCNTEQTLELKKDGCSNTLTTVQKDNMVLEPKIKIVGHMDGYEQTGRVYDPSGIACTLQSRDYKDPLRILEAKTAEPQVLRYERTEYGKAIRSQYEKGEVSERRCNMREFRPREDGISNTLTTVQKDNMVLEPKIKNIGSINGHQSGNVLHHDSDLSPCLCVAGHVEPLKIMQPVIVGGEIPMVIDAEPVTIKRLGNLYDENAGGARAGNVYAPNGLAPALQTAQGGNRQPLMYEDYRIRKLTPRECFRLMGFTDAEFDRIKGVSNTQLYKMAGNSIVVNVLEAIFKQLFKENHKE